MLVNVIFETLTLYTDYTVVHKIVPIYFRWRNRDLINNLKCTDGIATELKEEREMFLHSRCSKPCHTLTDLTTWWSASHTTQPSKDGKH